MQNSRNKLILIGSLPPPIHGSSMYFQTLLFSDINHYFNVFHLDTSDHRNIDNLTKLDFINVYLALKHIIKLIYFLVKIKPNIVYIPISVSRLPFIRDGLFILISFFFSKAKIIIHLHGGNYFRNEFYKNESILYRSFIRLSLSKVNTAIVLGNSLIPVFANLVNNVKVLYNGINYSENFIASSSRNTSLTIGYLGNLILSKGILDLLESFKIVHQEQPNIKLIYAGNYWKQDKAKTLVEDFIINNNLTTSIDYWGHIEWERKTSFFDSIDIFVFPTWYPYEGLPLVILEAMAAQKPVISSKDVGVISEVIDHGETGILVAQRKPEDLANAILTFVYSPELIKRMGLAGRKRFLENFTIEKNIKEMINILNN